MSITTRVSDVLISLVVSLTTLNSKFLVEISDNSVHDTIMLELESPHW